MIRRILIFLGVCIAIWVLSQSIVGLALIFFGIPIGIWTWIVTAITRRIASKFNISAVNQKWKFRFIFIFVFFGPFLDQIIGSLQFYYLCQTQAKVWIDPNWRQVKRAINRNSPIQVLNIFQGYLIPIEVLRFDYYDQDTGKLFIRDTHLRTDGGFLMRTEWGLGLGLGRPTGCAPPNWLSARREINLHQLLTQGKSNDSH